MRIIGEVVRGGGDSNVALDAVKRELQPRLRGRRSRRSRVLMAGVRVWDNWRVFLGLWRLRNVIRGSYLVLGFLEPALLGRDCSGICPRGWEWDTSLAVDVNDRMRKM